MLHSDCIVSGCLQDGIPKKTVTLHVCIVLATSYLQTVSSNTASRHSLNHPLGYRTMPPSSSCLDANKGWNIQLWYRDRHHWVSMLDRPLGCQQKSLSIISRRCPNTMETPCHASYGGLILKEAQPHWVKLWFGRQGTSRHSFTWEIDEQIMNSLPRHLPRYLLLLTALLSPRISELVWSCGLIPPWAYDILA